MLNVFPNDRYRKCSKYSKEVKNPVHWDDQVKQDVDTLIASIVDSPKGLLQRSYIYELYHILKALIYSNEMDGFEDCLKKMKQMNLTIDWEYNLCTGNGIDMALWVWPTLHRQYPPHIDIIFGRFLRYYHVYDMRLTYQAASSLLSQFSDDRVRVINVKLQYLEILGFFLLSLKSARTEHEESGLATKHAELVVSYAKAVVTMCSDMTKKVTKIVSKEVMKEFISYAINIEEALQAPNQAEAVLSTIRDIFSWNPAVGLPDNFCFDNNQIETTQVSNTVNYFINSTTIPPFQSLVAPSINTNNYSSHYHPDRRNNLELQS